MSCHVQPTVLSSELPYGPFKLLFVKLCIVEGRTMDKIGLNLDVN